MFARIAADVGSRIAQTVKQGKTSCHLLFIQIRGCIGDQDLKRQASVVIIVLGTSLGSWSLGRLSVSESRGSAVPSSIEMKDVFKDAQGRFACRPQEAQGRGEGISVLVRPEGSVVGSKNGSKYHLPRCPGAGAIKEENKIWFESESVAQAAGYTRAGNCK